MNVDSRVLILREYPQYVATGLQLRCLGLTRDAPLSSQLTLGKRNEADSSDLEATMVYAHIWAIFCVVPTRYALLNNLVTSSRNYQECPNLEMVLTGEVDNFRPYL